jgi:hypothetical protein
MKKSFLALVAAVSLVLTGCYETIEEVTMKTDGSGTYSISNDFSAVVGLAKSMGGADAEEMAQLKQDTTIQLASMIDSIPSLTTEEKALMKAGTLRVNMDMPAEKAVFNISFNFKNSSEIPAYGQLANKLMSDFMSKQMAGGNADAGGAMPEQSSMLSYYATSFKDDQVKRKLDKDKYAGVGSDEFLNGMKEASGMGIPMTHTMVLNLAKPAKKAEGKNVKLSDDRKKVTIKGDLDAFFDSAEDLEFEIEY